MIKQLYEEYERTIISMLMGDNNDNKDIIINSLEPEMFMSELHRLLFEACKFLKAKGLEVNKYSLLEFIGDEKYLHVIEEITQEYITSVNYAYFVDKIRTNYLNRMIQTAQSIDDLEKLEAIKSETIENGGLVSIGYNSDVLIGDYYEKADTAISTGYQCLDNVIGSLRGGDFVILAGATAMGKAIDLEAKILTNKGWVKNKDLKIGDKIIGRDGKETKVIGIYPQGYTNNYKMTLKDGREIISCENHLWTVYSSHWKKYRTFTTKELFKKMQCKSYNKRISLPKFTGDYGIKKDFVIHPYVLGVLIGDGCLTVKSLMYSKPSLKVFEKVKSFVPDKVDVHFVTKDTVSLCNWAEAKNKIKEWGLNTQSYNKFIPQEYFHCSKEQREQLLQGLLDTDGYSTGKCYEYSTTSKQLAKDVQQLAWSLGYNCRMLERMGRYKKNGIIKETRINYRLYITHCKPLTIYDIKPCESSKTQCISVDNKEKLFVIEDYIVTHNTMMMLNLIDNIACGNHKVALFSLEMSIQSLQNRLICKNTGINASKYRSFGMTELEAKAYQEFADKLKYYPIFVNKEYKFDVNKIRRYCKKCNPDIVFIDYLGLIQDTKNNKSKYEKVSDISTGLKQLSLELNVPIIALQQLSRGVESRNDKRPILADLRDSGQIEQDADLIMFCYRPNYYDRDNTSTDASEFQIIVAKNRNGKAGVTVPLKVNLSTQEITEVGKRHVLEIVKYNIR